MSIKTHYALRQTGKTDNGVMSQANSIGINALHYWPQDDSTGTAMADVGRTGTADATLTAVTAGTGFNAVRGLAADIWDADIAAAGTNDFLVMAVAKNTITRTQIKINLVSAGLAMTVLLAGGTTTPLTIGGIGTAGPDPVDDTPHIFAVARVGTNVLSYFDGVLLGTVSGLDANITDPIALNTLGGSQLKGNAANTIDLYGILYMQFANGLPADLIAGMDWMSTQWQADNHVLYPGWVTLD